MKLPCLIAILAGAGAVFATPAWATCQRSVTTFDLPAERLDEAVQQLSHRTGCFVRTNPSLIADRRVAALRGSYTPEQALARLVRHTGYTAYATKDGLAFDRHVLDVTMSQARALRTALDNKARSGMIRAAEATRLRARLTGVQRSLPALVNRQGMVTRAQRAEVVRALDAVRAVTGPVEDATGWGAFRHGV